MKHAALIAVSVVALALAGCGKKESPPPQPTSDATDIAAAPADLSSGQAFANTAAASDTFEIESSKLAAGQGASAKVKSFAANMIKAHTESTAKLQAAAATAAPAITPSPTLNPTQQQTLDMLKTKSGADFDTAYAKAQVDAHQMALDGLKAYSTSGDVPSLKSFASQMVPTVTAHLNMAKGL